MGVTRGKSGESKGVYSLPCLGVSFNWIESFSNLFANLTSTATRIFPADIVQTNTRIYNQTDVRTAILQIDSEFLANQEHAYLMGSLKLLLNFANLLTN